MLHLGRCKPRNLVLVRRTLSRRFQPFAAEHLQWAVALVCRHGRDDSCHQPPRRRRHGRLCHKGAEVAFPERTSAADMVPGVKGTRLGSYRGVASRRGRAPHRRRSRRRGTKDKRTRVSSALPRSRDAEIVALRRLGPLAAGRVSLAAMAMLVHDMGSDIAHRVPGFEVIGMAGDDELEPWAGCERRKPLASSSHLLDRRVRNGGRHVTKKTADRWGAAKKDSPAAARQICP